MEEENFFIPPEIPDEPAPSRFPVSRQLMILGGLLFLLLGGALLPTLFPSPEPADILVEKQATETDATTFQKVTVRTIGDVGLKAHSAYVYDVRTKRALYNKNADKVLPLASITKLMTTLVTHELMTESANVTVPDAAIRQDGASGLSAGERFSADALIDYAVLASSNDAAYALAVAAGELLDPDRPADTFVAAMNLRAKELELPSLKFYNPTGLDLSATKAGAYGSARDVTFLMEYILTNYPELLSKTTIADDRIYNEAGVYHEAENTNTIISDIPNLLGSKTGYTDLAGGNLTIAFDAGFDRPIIITVLGSTYTERFSDVEALVKAVNEAFLSER